MKVDIGRMADESEGRSPGALFGGGAKQPGVEPEATAADIVFN